MNPLPALPTLPSLRPGERRVMQRRPPHNAAEWAERWRILQKSSLPGPWKNAVTPYLTGVMAEFSKPWVREVVLVKGVQTGGTEAAYNCLAWWADRSSHTALVVMADERSVRKLSKERLLPMFQESPRLKALLSANPDDTTIYQLLLATGTSINIGWATSQVAVASTPCELVILDEIDKYQSGINLQEAKRRVTTYPHSSKIFALSTPGLDTGPITQELADCDEVRDYHVPCPACGEFQPMVWDQFRYPQEENLFGGPGKPLADARTIRRLKLARYECRSCGDRWDDYRRDLAVRRGDWVSRAEPLDRPRKVGFHLPAWLSRFVSLSGVVADWLEAGNDLARLRMWHNTLAAQPFNYVEQDDTRLDEQLYRRRRQYGPDGADWEVPLGGLVLTCAVDVQDNRLECELVAWGRGFESWGIDYKVFPGSPGKEQVWQDLEEWAQRPRRHESGQEIPVAAAIVDTGGHFTRESYYWLYARRGRTAPRWYGCKGASRADAPLASWSERSARKKKMPLLIIGTGAAKETITGWLREENPGPGYLHFPATYPFDVFRMLTAEKMVKERDKRGYEKTVWVKKAPGVRNEALDLRVYALALVTWLHPDWNSIEARYRQQAAAGTPPPPRQRKIYSKGVARD